MVRFNIPDNNTVAGLVKTGIHPNWCLITGCLPQEREVGFILAIVGYDGILLCNRLGQYLGKFAGLHRNMCAGSNEKGYVLMRYTMRVQPFEQGRKYDRVGDRAGFIIDRNGNPGI